MKNLFVLRQANINFVSDVKPYNHVSLWNFCIIANYKNKKPEHAKKCRPKNCMFKNVRKFTVIWMIEH